MLISPAAAAPSEMAAVSLEDIRIANGAVRYNDERSGAWGRFDGLNAQFSLAAMEQPLSGSGSFVAEGETFQFKSTLGFAVPISPPSAPPSCCSPSPACR